MACGRPVIASSMTGHMDVVSASNALCLTHYEPVLAVAGGAPAGVWFEASVDETVALLEKAYNDVRLLRQLGDAAGKSMKDFPGARRLASFTPLVAISLEVVKLRFPMSCRLIPLSRLLSCSGRVTMSVRKGGTRDCWLYRRLMPACTATWVLYWIALGAMVKPYFIMKKRCLASRLC
jgi:hypothetical protein